MFSSFRTLRALLVAISSCSLALSLPTTSAGSLVVPVKRSFGDYIDNIIYINGNKTDLYSAISLGSQTYAAKLDNRWDSLLIHAGGNASQTSNIPLGGTQIKVSDGRGEVGFLEDDLDIEYFTVTEWPSVLPKANVDGVGDAYIGLDINNGMSPIYYYFAARWPDDYTKWFYDVILTYDWTDAPSSSHSAEFAGVLTAGKTLSWESLFNINSTTVQSYGLPSLDGISSQPEIYLTDDGTFEVDNVFIVNGNKLAVNSSVPKTPKDKVILDIQYSRRHSQFPDSIVDALYSKAPGAKFTPDSTFGFWTVPCDTKVSFSFTIDNKEYKIDSDVLLTPSPSGKDCIGTIQTKGQAVSAVPEFDAILGFQAMGSLYYRAGINHTNNKPYYQLLPLDVPANGVGLGGSASSYAVTYADPTTTNTVSHATSTLYSSAAVSTDTWADHASVTSSTFTNPSATYATGSAAPSNDPATKAAGNLAATDDDEDGDSGAAFWRKRAQLFEYIMIGLAAALGIALIALVALFVRAARARKSASRPSAYRNIHEDEMTEPKVGLYDAEGGQSRYADPYSDHRQ